MMFASARRSIARRLAVAFTGVWLYAALSPCLMAAGEHDCPDCPLASAATHADDTACASATAVDCALPDLNPVTVEKPAHLPSPVAVLAIVPVATAAPPFSARFQRHSENAALHAPPPLALRPAVLLI